MRRSKEQHFYEWWCYRLIANDVGSTPYEIYVIMARTLLKEVDESGKLVIRKPTSLQDWEHQIYMEQVKYLVNKVFPRFIWPEPKSLPVVEHRKYE